jgi:hypothetical protein
MSVRRATPVPHREDGRSPPTPRSRWLAHAGSTDASAASIQSASIAERLAHALKTKSREHAAPSAERQFGPMIDVQTASASQAARSVWRAQPTGVDPQSGRSTSPLYVVPLGAAPSSCHPPTSR